jgi:hypothetical protein
VTHVRNPPLPSLPRKRDVPITEHTEPLRDSFESDDSECVRARSALSLLYPREAARLGHSVSQEEI